jgi:hypothetical protein
VSDYRFDDLGWHQFEQLCQTLLKAVHGAALEAWGGSGDWGCDLFSAGPLEYPTIGHSNPGPFVFQVKFVEAANAAGASPLPALMNAVRKERDRIKKRLARGEWDSPRYYTLITNAPLKPAGRNAVARELRKAIPTADVITMGARDVTTLLEAHPGVRTSYPQVLGLQDLQSLLRSAVSSDTSIRSRAWLREAGDLARVFVATQAYQEALRTLRQHHFLVLTGPPEMGKTAIARMVSLAKVTEQWDAFECRRPDEFFRNYVPDHNQVFVADDAFGSTEYRPELATEWAAELPRIFRLTDRSHWMVFTSRPGPLREALRRLYLQGPARRFPKPGEVQVDASRLRVQEKAEMLYRHAKAASLGPQANEIVRAYARRIVNNTHFTPFRIQRLVQEYMPGIVNLPPGEQVHAMERAVAEGLERPTEAMLTSFVGLSSDHKALLFAMLDVEQGPIPLPYLLAGVKEYLQRPPVLEIRALASDIEDHFVKSIQVGGSEDPHVDWIHPSVRDVVILYLMSHEQDRINFLSAASTSAVVLALSTAGGREGTTSFPLADTAGDWETLEARVRKLIRSRTSQHRTHLLEGVLAALETRGPGSERQDRLRDLATSLLEELDKTWQENDEVISVRALNAFYRLSKAIGTPADLYQRLMPTWDALTDAARGAAEAELDDIKPLNAWIEFVALISKFEPSFLELGQTEDVLSDLTSTLVEALDHRITTLEDLDPEEEDEYEVAQGEYASGPLEPGYDEDWEREWLGEAVPAIEDLQGIASDYSPDLLRSLELLFGDAQRHLSAREERHERWENYTESEPDHDYLRPSRGSPPFDIDSLFADL